MNYKTIHCKQCIKGHISASD